MKNEERNEQDFEDFFEETKELPDLIKEDVGGTEEPESPQSPADDAEALDFEDFATTDAAVERGEENDPDDVSLYYPDDEALHIADDAEEAAFQSERHKRIEKNKKKNARLTRSQLTLIIVIVILYTLVIVTASWILFYKPSQPKNEELPFDINPVDAEDPTKPPLETVLIPGTDPDDIEPGVLDDSDSDSKSGDGKKSSTGYTPIDGRYNILVVGIDKQANLADVNMIVNVDTNENTVTVMQIPRDTIVSTGVVSNKVNAQFASYVGQEYRSGSDDTYKSAMSDYARFLEKSLCIKIHNTVMITLEGFRNIVDAVDGVDVYVPGPMYYTDPEQGLYIAIDQGYHHMDGATAEGFVRFRSGYLQADLGRMNAQKIFLTAFYNRVQELIKYFGVSNLTNLASQIIKYTTTDMSVSDMMFFVKAAANIGMENITMLTMPGEAETVTMYYYVMNRAATLQVINDHFNIYDKAIDNSIFDRAPTFCFNDLNYISSIYYASAASAYTSEYDAESINNNNIAIPFK